MRSRRRRFAHHRPRGLRPVKVPAVLAEVMLGLSSDGIRQVQEAHRRGAPITYRCVWQGVPTEVIYAGLAAKKGGA